jgi:superfamily II DNA or RNA helicase
MNLRPYQQAAFDSIQAGWAEAQKQLAVMATGGGKTILFSHLAAAEPGRTLILAITADLDKSKVETAEAWRNQGAQVEIYIHAGTHFRTGATTCFIPAPKSPESEERGKL